MPTNWWMVHCTQAYEAEFERLWESVPAIRGAMSEFEASIQRRDLESWLARTAEARGTHLWIVTHEGMIDFMLECYPEDCLVRLIWPRLITTKSHSPDDVE